MEQPWEIGGKIPAVRVFGNLYFVGTVAASTHIVDTGDGYLLFDSGYDQTLSTVITQMQAVGLAPHKIRAILHTHGHIDHMGATRSLVALTGAKTYLGKADETYANGLADLSYAKELGMVFRETFQPDVLLQDGDTVALGNTTVTARATPGHTPGAMSYFFTVTDGVSAYRCGLHGGMGINTMCKAFLAAYGLSANCRTQFAAAMDRLCTEPVDIFLGNHASHNHTAEKAEAVRAGNPLAFVQPNEWHDYCLWAKQNMLNMVAEEQQKA